MRTTLHIDDDVLAAVCHLADLERRSLSDVVSTLVRRGLAGKSSVGTATRNGVPLLPFRAEGGPVTMDLVNRLCDGSL